MSVISRRAMSHEQRDLDEAVDLQALHERIERTRAAKEEMRALLRPLEQLLEDADRLALATGTGPGPTV